MNFVVRLLAIVFVILLANCHTHDPGNMGYVREWRVEGTRDTIKRDTVSQPFIDHFKMFDAGSISDSFKNKLFTIACCDSSLFIDSIGTFYVKGNGFVLYNGRKLRTTWFEFVGINKNIDEGASICLVEDVGIVFEMSWRVKYTLHNMKQFSSDSVYDYTDLTSKLFEDTLLFRPIHFLK